MCELLGMAARYPATLTSSLERFARHGGEEGPHADGWGLAYFDTESLDVRRIREPGMVTLTRRCDPAGADSLVTESLCPAGACQTVTLFSSVPLTDEPWRPLDHGEIAMLRLQESDDSSTVAR